VCNLDLWCAAKWSECGVRVTAETATAATPTTNIGLYPLHDATWRGKTSPLKIDYVLYNKLLCAPARLRKHRLRLRKRRQPVRVPVPELDRPQPLQRRRAGARLPVSLSLRRVLAPARLRSSGSGSRQILAAIDL
jgi:hypothetical protein